ncbi:MAG: GH32 C-terminal domain-containing protein, partial [Bifidobacterium criceti]|nr:GH32 C-terminal domain-containing protein [Bifidobacterium criceti]
ECPDFFPVRDADGNERWVIGFSAMGAKPHGFMNRNVNNAGYIIGSWKPGEAFEPETEFHLWDEGHNFYAPQSFNADGRQIMLGWMSPFVAPVPMEEDGWCGNLTLPRQITLGVDGRLVTAPVEEMKGLRARTVDFGPIDLNADQTATILEDDGGAAEVEMSIDLAHTTAERTGLHVHATEDGHDTAIVYDAQIGGVVIDRGNTANGDKGYRVAKLTEDELAADTLDLRVFIDRGCVEVYVNGGRHAMSSYSFPGEGPRAIRLVGESGTTRVPSLAVHALNGIGLG